MYFKTLNTVSYEQKILHMNSLFRLLSGYVLPIYNLVYISIIEYRLDCPSETDIYYMPCTYLNSQSKSLVLYWDISKTGMKLFLVFLLIQHFF